LIQTEVTTLEKSKTPENLLWSSVKKFFASESDKTQIKKFLYLRLADIKVMIEAVLIMTDNPVFVKCKSTDNTFSATGTIARFETACVNVKKVQGSTLDLPEVQGKFVFITGGSQSYTSDIDFSVDFDSTAATLRQRVKVVAQFIMLFNHIFTNLHKKSSLETYDVNLYSFNFGYPAMITELHPFKSGNDFSKFRAANRISQLLLFNDALHAFNQNQDAKLVIANPFATKITELISAAGNCVKPLADDGTTLSVKQLRSVNVDDRNAAMTKYLVAFGSKDGLDSLCNLLASNYQAPEAYISYASVLDIITLQPILDQTSLTTEEKNFVMKLDKNEVIDSLLMSLAYGIEHAFEHSYDSGKFGKYMSRVLRLAVMLDTTDSARKCLLDTFELLVNEKIPTFSDVRKDALATVKDYRKKYAATGEELARIFIRSAVKCVGDSHGDIKSRRRKTKKVNK